MLNVAICDDDIHITGEMDTIILKIARQMFVDVEIEVFWNGESLVETIENGTYFDIIFLDIEMEKENGANSHFLRPAGPHFPASQGHIKRPVLEIGRAERGLRPANQYRALSQKAMLSQSVR